MGKVNDTLHELVRFFEMQEGYDKNDIIAEIMDSLEIYESEDIELLYGEESLGSLYDFTNEFYSKVIKGVCNVIKGTEEFEEITTDLEDNGYSFEIGV